MRDRFTAFFFNDDVLSRLVLLGAIMVVALATDGCGKKAPPMAPRQTPLAAVMDLQAVVDGAGVTLTWQHSAENHRAAGYLVLRAQAAINQPPCPGCPQIFQKVETLRLSRSRRNQAHSLTFSQALANDFRYTYSVRPFHPSGRQGPDSNLVEIEGHVPVLPGQEKPNPEPSNKETGTDP